MKKVLGILGGMGPLASAEFLKTIYEFNLADREQEMPVCFLYSDPTIPDRTEAIANGLDDLLLNDLITVLETLYLLGVDKIVIPCITIHYFLPKVPLILREKIVSLVDLILEEVLNRQEHQLLLCTQGTLNACIFQQHRLWKWAEPYIIVPQAEHKQIHNLIYQIKKEGIQKSALAFLNTLLNKYEVNSFIAGCTEFHLLAKYLIQHNARYYRVVDPLLIIATNLRKFIDLQSHDTDFITIDSRRRSPIYSFNKH
ncbi:amino acid racemase [Chroococcidiopsis sp. FACHB-1243]|uniref:aspartate/glutamate racemase family protein n=1 Tax=Chroococcidiopsis sp. [FACHB-1243] TaxID=2692781 RepID=UPI0017808AEB|nr:amino acid racemase [Chroococcidiopsis sp. [FACHB-1243]]MBD2309510.1 amino acid racemase [Chroococcidiopsis sp. [FACHB-1243]]